MSLVVRDSVRGQAGVAQRGAVLDDCVWPLTRLGEGLGELTRRSGLAPASSEPMVVPDAVVRGDVAELDRWMRWAGGRIGIDLDPIETTVPDVDRLLLGAGPAVLRIRTADGLRLLLLLPSRSGRPRLIAPDLRVRTCSMAELRAAICDEFEAPLRPVLDRLLEAAHVAPRRRPAVRAAMIRERLAAQRVGGCWMARLPPTSNFGQQLARERVPARLVLMLAIFAFVYALEILSWSVIGDAALNGRLDLGWLTAWILLVLSIVPLRLAGGWLDATLAVDVGGLLKLRLLLGALRLDIGAIKHQGVGQMLARVMECQALEALAVNGGLAVLVALLELGVATWVLSVGAGGAFHVMILLAWLGVVGVLGWRYHRRLAAWTLTRFAMTHDFVEQMVGHRTRLAQDWPDRRDRFEDNAAKGYFEVSAAMDRAVLPFLAGVPNGWMLVGLVGLLPAFVTGSGSPASFAIGLGGILIAHRALSGIAGGIAAFARTTVAWEQAAPLFHAGAKPLSTAAFVARAPEARPVRLLDADGLSFRYHPADEPVLNRASLSIGTGERILLEGASGGGKSTLASLLVGLRQPSAGLLLLNGLDRHTLGDAWHEIATEAPQFHENHIFTATMGFNLLMGRNWPASDDELKEAEALCIELGLGDLLQRMPSGMMQTVGETGWQLSHGERSRIFLARAILQDAQLTILDESFAALDPETLKSCLDCVFRRVKTLVVIAHP